MTIEILVAAALVVALLLSALAGGADFGGGMWTTLARGETAGEEARLVDRAIGPIWEANELWIVVAMVILWSGFTDAFVAFGISLWLMFKESALGYGHDLSDYQPNGRCSEQKVATRTFSSRRIAMPKV